MPFLRQRVASEVNSPTSTLADDESLFEAQQEFAPNIRPYLISRSGSTE